MPLYFMVREISQNKNKKPSFLRIISDLVEGKLWNSYLKRLLRLEGFGPPHIRRARVEGSRVPVKKLIEMQAVKIFEGISQTLFGYL
jgi:hypothetical protein